MRRSPGWQTCLQARACAIVVQRRFRPALAPVVVLLALVGLITATAPPSRAAATAKPCGERVIDDWLDNGTIEGTYTPGCYQAALKQVPEDLRDYTNIEDVITAALQRSLRGRNAGASLPGSANGNQGGSSDDTSSGSGPENGTGSGGPGGTTRTLQVAPQRSYYRRAIDNLGSTKANSVPVPLLALAGLGTGLLLTASGLAARQRLRARAERQGKRTV